MPVPQKPTGPKAWATDVSSKTSPVNPAKQLLGFFGEIIPDAIWNTVLNKIYQWIDVLDLHQASFDSIEDAINQMQQHGHAVVDVDPETQYASKTDGSLSGDRVVALDTDGLHVYLARFDGVNAYVVERRLISDWSLDLTYTLSGTPDASNPVKAISADGGHVAVVWGAVVDVFVVDTATAAQTFNAGLAIASDAFVSGDQLHVFYRDNGATTSLVASYELTTYTAVGTLVTSVNSDNEGAICSDGHYVYVAHHNNTNTVIDVMAYDMSSIVSSTTYAGDLVLHRAISCNGHYIVVGAPDTPNTARVFAISYTASGATLVQVGQVDHDTFGYAVCMLHDRFVLSTSAGGNTTIYVHALPGLELMAQFAMESAQISENEVCTDGQHVFYPANNASRRVARTDLGIAARSWRRCDGAERYRQPFYTLLVPGQ